MRSVRVVLAWCARVCVLMVCMRVCMGMYVWATTSTWAWAPLVSVVPTMVCGVVGIMVMCVHGTHTHR